MGTTLKTWAGKDENKVAAQAKLVQRAMANSKAQLGKYDPATADEDASAAENMYVKNYVYLLSSTGEPPPAPPVLTDFTLFNCMLSLRVLSDGEDFRHKSGWRVL